MGRALIFGLFLLYFWYFYWPQTAEASPPKPAHGSHEPARSFHPRFRTRPDDERRFQFRIGESIVWEEAVPDSYTFDRERLIPRDACESVLDGGKVLAEGYELYDYLRENAPDEEDDDRWAFEGESDFVFREGGKFYFTCLGGRIDRLRMCPPNEMFLDGRCETIQTCAGLPDGTRLPDPNHKTSYVECLHLRPTRRKCPPETFFHVGTCRPMADLIHYCRFYVDAFLLDETTRVRCDGRKPVFVRCPPLSRFFDVASDCESTACVGLADGTKFALPQRTDDDGELRFSPGYLECREQRIGNAVLCPQYWDDFFSHGENLLHLPMMFDGVECTPPKLGSNVFPVHPDEFVVPVHEFSKHVRNWKDADYFDSFSGYEYRGGKRKRIDLPPGERIGKKFRRESACLEETDPDYRPFVPVAGHPRDLFDCTTRTRRHCERGRQFDGFECQPAPSDKSFEYNGRHFFRFDNLSFDDWIRPWHPSHRASPEPCDGPESAFVLAYNLCSHPDCVPYPFLSQVPELGILLPDGNSRCVYDPYARRLSRETVDFEYDFWTQRMVDRAATEAVAHLERPCVPGQAIRSGNFVWDSSVHATCDANQPFVFCPSADTRGIVSVDGRRFACGPPPFSSVFFAPATEWTLFSQNEIKNIKPVDTGQPTAIALNRGAPEVLNSYGKDIPERMRVNLNVSRPVVLTYRYRVTHPPDVVFQDGEARVANRPTAAFSILNGEGHFANRSLEFPRYNVESFTAAQFNVELYTGLVD